MERDTSSFSQRHEGWKWEPEFDSPKPRRVIYDSYYPAMKTTISLVMLLICVVLFSSIYLKHVYILKKGVHATGTVMKSYEERDIYPGYFGFSNNYFLLVENESKILVRLEVDKVTFQNISVGSIVNFRYVPSDLGWALLDDDQPNGFLAGVFILLSILIFFIGMEIYRIHEIKRILSIGDPIAAQVESVGGSTFRPWLQLIYLYKGKQWKINAHTNQRSNDPVLGEVITVVIDPENPRKAVTYAWCGYRVA